MNKLTIEEWLIEHISNHPNITFGSLYRDICLTRKVDKRSIENLRSVIEECKEKGLIVETNKNYNSFFNLSKQLSREEKLNNLGI
jgi:hypothetical protein